MEFQLEPDFGPPEPEYERCEDCHGTGRIECVAYYFGVAECSTCGGSGVLYPEDYEA